jgi:hypothetical protein
MTDVADAYGYPLATMERLAGAPIPPRVNVGFCGLRSDEIDWDRLEHWTRQLALVHPHYYFGAGPERDALRRTTVHRSAQL